VSVQAIGQCWGPTFPVSAPGISPQTVRLVAIAVADVVNDVHHNEFWGARRLLAEKVGIDPDTVSDVMQHLCAVGVIEVVERNPGKSVRYRWLGGGGPPPLPEPGSGGSPPLPAVAEPLGSGGVTAGGAVGSPPNTESNANHSKGNPNNARLSKIDKHGEDQKFEAFWIAYGRIGPRKKARECWDSAIKRDTPESIHAGLLLWLAYWEHPDASKPKWPQGWLNQDYWRDEPPKILDRKRESMVDRAFRERREQRDGPRNG